MDWKLGEIRKVDGEWYQCVAHSRCSACSFYKNDTICHSLGCSGLVDRDSTSVAFKKLMKYRHPFFMNGHKFQLYLLLEPVMTLPESEEVKLVRWDIVQIMETI